MKVVVTAGSVIQNMKNEGHTAISRWGLPKLWWLYWRPRTKSIFALPATPILGDPELMLLRVRETT